MGPGRGGAYTYDWIERRLGIDIHNSDRSIPEFQHLQVGDEIPMPGYAMRVERLEPERAMVVRSSNHAWVWSFELRSAGGHTRLISRNRFDTAALPWKDKLAYPIIEPGSWVMERKMLLTSRSGPNGSPGRRHQPNDSWPHAGTDRDVTEYPQAGRDLRRARALPGSARPARPVVPR
jgi:hypothetical protein